MGRLKVFSLPSLFPFAFFLTSSCYPLSSLPSYCPVVSMGLGTIACEGRAGEGFIFLLLGRGGSIPAGKRETILAFSAQKKSSR